MPLDKLIDLLAEAAVRKLSQEREAKEATPDAIRTIYWGLRPYYVLIFLRHVLHSPSGDYRPETHRS